MANNIINIRKNYREVEGEEFYRYVFPNNQNEGEGSVAKF